MTITTRTKPDPNANNTANTADSTADSTAANTSAEPSPTRRLWNPLTLAFFGGLWIASVCNWPLWRTLSALPEMGSGRGAVFIGGFFVMMAALTTAMLALFAWRLTIKPALVIVFVCAAVGAYFMGSYGVVLDPTMLGNMLVTNASEARDLMNPPLAVSLVLLAGLPWWWLFRVRVAQRPSLRQLGRNVGVIVAALALIALIVFALFADMAATMRNHKSLRYMINPVNSFYSLAVALKGVEAKHTGPLIAVGADAVRRPLTAGAKPPLLMLQVGETGRSGNFSLNGYARPTNPELSKLGVVSFTDVTSCGTNTTASVPCMFSSLGRVGFQSRQGEYENLLDVLQRAGFAVLWVDNQSGCKDVCNRVAHVQTTDLAPGGTPLPAALCREDECLDDALLHDLDLRIAALPAERRAVGVVLVMHQMGSHGPAYSRRSPQDRKPFMPECTTKVLQQCEPQQLVNAYDNSIAYTDHVLAESVAWLQTKTTDYETSMIYVADHGESLGERNIYLHGMPYAMAPVEQTHVPMVVWGPVGPGSRVDVACLNRHRDIKLTHDNLFHTVLGVVDVQTSAYQPGLDAFAVCQRSARG